VFNNSKMCCISPPNALDKVALAKATVKRSSKLLDKRNKNVWFLASSVRLASSSQESGADDFKWKSQFRRPPKAKTNYYKDSWNKRLFGPTLKTKPVETAAADVTTNETVADDDVTKDTEKKPKKATKKKKKKKAVKAAPKKGAADLDVALELDPHDPVALEHDNFWMARSATLTNILHTSKGKTKANHDAQSEFGKAIADAAMLAETSTSSPAAETSTSLPVAGKPPSFPANNTQNFVAGGEDAMLATLAEIYSQGEQSAAAKSRASLPAAGKPASAPAKKRAIPPPPPPDPKHKYHPARSPLVNTSRPGFKVGQVMLGKTTTIRHDRNTDKKNVDSVTHSLPSVTKILKETMAEQDRLRLQIWEERMVAKMGREAFEQMSKNTLLRGERLHYMIEQYFELGTADHLDVSDTVSKNHWRSLSPLMERFARPPLAVESSVVHPDLGYKGYMDCVTVVYNPEHPEKSQLVLIDWKTSGKAKTSLSKTFDNPLQIAAYVGAFNWDDRYPIRVEGGMIVVVYNDGAPATLLPITKAKLEKYWWLWLQRLRLYKEGMMGPK